MSPTISGMRAREEGPKLLEASWIGRAAAGRVRNQGLIGVVDSVFKEAANISTRLGLVSIVSEHSGRGPLNVNVELGEVKNLRAAGLKRGLPVMRTKMTLTLGDRVIISTLHARSYNTPKRFARPVLEPERIRRNLEKAKDSALASGHLGGLGALIQIVGELGEVTRTRGSSSYSAAALPRINSFVRAVRSRNIAGIRDSSRQLVGLGPGLTPSADDMLSGVMLAMITNARSTGIGERFASALGRATTAEVRERTTALSAEYLLQASKGRGNEHIIRLLEEVLTGDSTAVRDAVERVVRIGETSGTDTILGVLLGVQLILDRRTNSLP